MIFENKKGAKFEVGDEVTVKTFKKHGIIKFFLWDGSNWRYEVEVRANNHLRGLWSIIESNLEKKNES